MLTHQWDHGTLFRMLNQFSFSSCSLSTQDQPDLKVLGQ